MDRSAIERSLRSIADPGRMTGFEMTDCFITYARSWRSIVRVGLQGKFGVSAFGRSGFGVRGSASAKRSALIAGLPAFERLERALETPPPERPPEDNRPCRMRLVCLQLSHHQIHRSIDWNSDHPLIFVYPVILCQDLLIFCI